jgi:HPr kinase/phosphorylase
MYGVGAVINNKPIDIVVYLEFWDNSKEYDRLGLTEEYTEILGVRVPKIVVPVRPGRNLAIIVEVAARNWRLKHMGYNAAQELDNRLNALIQMNKG